MCRSTMSDFSSTSPPFQRPADADLLSPHGHDRTLLHDPSSPTPTDLSFNDLSTMIPPSPTLSNCSVHFDTSVALRDNKPDARSNASSLFLTTPLDPKGTSAAAFHQRSEEAAHQVELRQEADMGSSPSPFHFKPYELANLLDAKNLDALESLGGVDALLSGLNTSRDKGLTQQALERSETISGHVPGDGRPPDPGSGGASRRRYPQKQGHTVTEPSDEVKSTHEDEGNTEAAFAASLAERRRIYGENLLPPRPSKTLLQLMATAVKDKVLVCLFIRCLWNSF